MHRAGEYRDVNWELVVVSGLYPLVNRGRVSDSGDGESKQDATHHFSETNKEPARAAVVKQAVSLEPRPLSSLLSHFTPESTAPSQLQSQEKAMVRP